MDLHVVRPGDTLYGIAREYGVSMDRLLQDNQLPDPSQLVVGQVILVRYPALTHVVKEGDTLWSVARSYQVGPDQLLRNNPGLRGLDRIFPGQALVIRYQGEPQGTLTVNAYAYPSIDKALLTAALPYLSQLTPFTFQFTADGTLLPPEDGALTQAALQAGVSPIFHLSSLSDGGFSGELVHQLLSDETARDRLIAAVAETARAGGYRGWTWTSSSSMAWTPGPTPISSPGCGGPSPLCPSRWPWPPSSPTARPGGCTRGWTFPC